MRNAKIVVLVTTALLGVTGCGGGFSIEKAPLVAYNNSSNPTIVVAEGIERVTVAAGKSANFHIEIRVPHNRVGDYGPSQIDKEISVSIVFRDTVTGGNSYPVSCRAGAKVVTKVVYDGRYANCLY